MKQYDSYKDSGVQWIGEIPSHWEVMQLKNTLCSMQDGTHGTFQRIPSPYLLLSAKNVFEDGIHISESESSISKLDYHSIISNGFPSIGDIVICCVGTIGRCCIYKETQPLAFQRSVTFLRVKEQVSNLFLLFLIRSNIFQIQLNTLAKTSAQSGVYMGDLASIKVTVPSFLEQQAIASYLDKKCAEIDKAIATQQRRIELLQELRQNIITRAVTRGINPDVPLKDSGVEWIGMVPEHWEIKRIKHCANIFGRIGFRGYTTEDLVSEGEGPITLSPSNMQGKMNYDSCSYLSWYKYNESPEIQIYNGDVLFVKTGSTYGKSAYVENLPMEATINPQIVVFKDFNNCNSKFFYYMLTTHVVQNQVDNTVIGSTIPTIGQEKIRNYVLPIPPFNEQQAIVAYIESETGKLDKQVAKANRQISLLQELKQSIITEVVTGKRKVC